MHMRCIVYTFDLFTNRDILNFIISRCEMTRTIDHHLPLLRMHNGFVVGLLDLFWSVIPHVTR